MNSMYQVSQKSEQVCRVVLQIIYLSSEENEISVSLEKTELTRYQTSQPYLKPNIHIEAFTSYKLRVHTNTYCFQNTNCVKYNRLLILMNQRIRNNCNFCIPYGTILPYPGSYKRYKAYRKFHHRH